MKKDDLAYSFIFLISMIDILVTMNMFQPTSMGYSTVERMF